MKTLKIRQTIAILILVIYFLCKILGFITIKVYPKVGNQQQYFYLLDSGHGYYGESCGGKAIMEETGTCFYEWKYNWQVRVYLAKMLNKAGIKYAFVNTDTVDVPLKDRIKKINTIPSKLPKVLISIHGNAASMKNDGWEKANGFEVYSSRSVKSSSEVYKDKKAVSDSLANKLALELKYEFPEHTLRTSSGKNFREKNFDIIYFPNCYTILSENEFFTNPNMRAKMKTEFFMLRVAKAHFRFILKLEKKL